MKKFLLVTIAMLVFASVSIAQFAPTQLVLYNAPEEVEYDFTGSACNITFQLQGTPASIWLIITTKDKAEDIVAVRNGNLGWHYVNKIDTTVYVSEKVTASIGDVTIPWDGTNADGALVDAGSYYYYLWAYDHVTPRYSASEYVNVGGNPQGQKQTKLMDYVGVDRTPNMDVWFACFPCWWNSSVTDSVETEALARFSDVSTWVNYRDNVPFTISKWDLGGEATDPTLLKKTLIFDLAYEYSEEPPYGMGGGIFDPADNTNTTFFITHLSMDEDRETIYKYDFVNGDLAQRDMDWGGFDNTEIQNKGCQGDPSYATLFTDGEYMYMAGRGLEVVDQEYNPMAAIDFEGEVIFDEYNIPGWYFPDALDTIGYCQRTFRYLDMMPQTSNILLSETNTCMMQLINLRQTILDPDTVDPDLVIWENANGDNFLDINSQPEDIPQWQCICDRHASGAINVRYSSTQDKYGMPIWGIGHSDLLSFGFATNDGTGVDLCSFGDDTISVSYMKGVVELCNNDSAWDGMYTNIPIEVHWYGHLAAQYVAWDNFRGVITDEASAVEDADEAAFAVDAPYPNPANPTTTIGFTIPETGHVSIDVYNVAGQKVDTLVNDVINAGKHSVAWDAGEFSAGVYFYTVKSGDYSKTMKVTILK